MQGFEWPEFRPGDRVKVRRPSEEAPPKQCGCLPTEIWDHTQTTSLAPEGVIVGGLQTYRGECAKCGQVMDVEGLHVFYVDSPVGHPGVLHSPINLELLEAAR